MAKLLIVKVENRPKAAVRVQEVLTQHGCSIKTRLGLHEFALGCEEKDEGLIILEIAGNDEEIRKLREALEAVESVKTVLVEI